MRSDMEVKYMLAEALQKTVRKAFLKRGFSDSFTEEELVKVREIDNFLRAVSLHKDNSMFEDKQVKYFCLSVRSTYFRKNGSEISVFVNKFIEQKEFEYKKIDYFVAKCIYRLSQNRFIELFFAVNSFKANLIKENVYLPERKGQNLVSSCAIYTDIDLPSELTNLSNEEVLNLIMTDYQELFKNLPPTYAVRSGGGLHLYFCLNESYHLKSEEQILFYMDMLRTLQRIFEDYGADCRCVDCTRILRVPNTKNRKPKYGADGKDVSIIYKTDTAYDVFTLDKKLKFLSSGGITGLSQSILDDIFYDYEEISQEVIYSAEESKVSEILEVPVNALEYEPKKRKVSATAKRLIDFGYKGIQEYYDYNGETYFQNKDMMAWISNRSHTEGARHILLFFFNYNWFVFNGVRNYEEMLVRSQKLNTYFKPMLSETELIQAVRSSFHALSKMKHHNRSIQNTTIQAYLQFTESERMYCCIGLYCDSATDYQKALAQKKRKLSKEYYQRKLEANSTTRKTEVKERYKKLLQENPLMSYQEFKQQTGLSKRSFDSYKKQIGNSKEKHYQEQRDYYLQLFKSNPNITCKEYTEKLNCSKSTYHKYKKMYIEDL